jgi:iron complex outermembrane receptor protein
MRRTVLLTCILFFTISLLSAQNKYGGRILDLETKEPVIGASVVIKGTTQGAATDADGKFLFTSNMQPPFTVVVSSMGFDNMEFPVTSISQSLEFSIKASSVSLKNVSIQDTRLTQKQQEQPLTVESLDLIGMKETPAANFYEGLGALKGVDITSASLGFKVINTRGFNSTSPVRSLQVIDGVDNQSPGLNFSLGNFLGSSELDLKKVDLIQGASSAFYGPNAFNGVVSMETKSPFDFTGLSFSTKVGERRLFEGAARWAQKFQHPKKDHDIFAYKVNFYYMKANDWEAENYDPATDSKTGRGNPGGYDAVNIYGDEQLYGKNDYITDRGERRNYAGLGVFYRDGYKEKDIVDYNTKNIKGNVALHFMIKKKYELITTSNFGYGTTVYQGENRYSLKNIQFFQNKVEIRQKDKFFVRFYATNEDAGDSYDAVVTAFQLRDNGTTQADWNTAYFKNYTSSLGYGGQFGKVHQLPGMPSPFGALSQYNYSQAASVLNLYQDTLAAWHQNVRDLVNSETNFLMPGTAAFDTAFAGVTNRLLGQGGSRFYDKSALFHLHGEYKFSAWKKILEFTVGGNARLYLPNSNGTIFSDTAGTRIYNVEAGVYLGIDFKLEKLKISLTNRVDKNINFPFLWSPALSFVYVPDKRHTLRLSLSSAIRNPTLTDQYFNYNVGRAILLGNLNGYDSLINVDSFREAYTGANIDLSKFEYFNVDPVRPERVWTAEIGYRGTLWKHLYIDLNAYYSFYQHFIGYRIGIDSEFNGAGYPVDPQVYRVASNSKDVVHTRGASIQLSYFFRKYYTISGNYTYNTLDRRGSTDGLIPAFNTPRHKFNVGFSGRDIEMKIGKANLKNWGFSINYKWIEGFLFEGSPQFTGTIPSYDMLDAQINYNWKKAHTTFKLGAQNLLNNKVYQVYGGPRVGRLAYFSIQFDMPDWGTGKNIGKNKKSTN